MGWKRIPIDITVTKTVLGCKELELVRDNKTRTTLWCSQLDKHSYFPQVSVGPNLSKSDG